MLGDKKCGQSSLPICLGEACWHFNCKPFRVKVLYMKQNTDSEILTVFSNLEAAHVSEQ